MYNLLNNIFKYPFKQYDRNAILDKLDKVTSIDDKLKWMLLNIENKILNIHGSPIYSSDYIININDHLSYSTYDSITRRKIYIYLDLGLSKFIYDINKVYDSISICVIYNSDIMTFDHLKFKTTTNPIGKLNTHESPNVGAKRELFEETGLKCKLTDLEFLGKQIYMLKNDLVKQNHFLYYSDEKPYNREPKKHKNMRFINLNTIIDNKSPELDFILKYLMKNNICR